MHSNKTEKKSHTDTRLCMLGQVLCTCMRVHVRNGNDIKITSRVMNQLASFCFVTCSSEDISLQKLTKNTNRRALNVAYVHSRRRLSSLVAKIPSVISAGILCCQEGFQKVSKMRISLPCTSMCPKSSDQTSTPIFLTIPTVGKG
jgi:hypothetical protein